MPLRTVAGKRLCGFEAAAAFSGPDGLTLAHASVFDVLITDMNMSPLSGIQTAKAFRDIHPNAHIFLLTGTIGDEDAMRERDKEGLDFQILRKPLHPLRVIEALRGLGSNPQQSQLSLADEPNGTYAIKPVRSERL